MKDKQMKIRQAAMIAGIGYENAKVIKRIYRKEGRDTKICFKNKPRNFRRGDVFINPELERKRLEEEAQKESKKAQDQAKGSSSARDVETNSDSEAQKEKTASGSQKELKKCDSSSALSV